MRAANPLWGAPRIHGELRKLGIDISQATVAKHLGRRPALPHRRPGRHLLRGVRPRDPKLRDRGGRGCPTCVRKYRTMPTAMNAVRSRVQAAAPTTVWTPFDFLDVGARNAVDKALRRLAASGLLRRIDRRLYDRRARSVIVHTDNRVRPCSLLRGRRVRNSTIRGRRRRGARWIGGLSRRSRIRMFASNRDEHR